MVRRVGEEILRRHGYEVLSAQDGEQAVAIYRQEQHRIGLVILNLGMPRVSWRDTLRRLYEINPQVRVLLASGHLESLDTSDTDGVVGVLAKPYRGEDLAVAVRKALDERSEEPVSDGGG